MSNRESGVRCTACAIDVVRDDEGAIIAVLEDEEVFVEQGVILCYPCLGYAGGHIERQDHEPCNTADRERLEETSLVTRHRKYVGCYLTWRDEYMDPAQLSRSKMVTYWVYESYLVGDIPRYPKLGDKLRGLIRITRDNVHTVQREHPFRMSVFKRILEDRLNDRAPFMEPFVETNRALAAYASPELVKKVHVGGAVPLRQRKAAQPVS